MTCLLNHPEQQQMSDKRRKKLRGDAGKTPSLDPQPVISETRGHQVGLGFFAARLASKRMSDKQRELLPKITSVPSCAFSSPHCRLAEDCGAEVSGPTGGQA